MGALDFSVTADEPVVMTRMVHGTDVNFGALASKLTHWLGEQEGCGFASSHRVTDLKKRDGRWQLAIRDLTGKRSFRNSAKFVFIGAGGGSLPLLQKAGIPEAKGIGGFPIGGQWLISEKPELIEQHNAKVYGMSPGAAPTMAVPHLDTRIIDGKQSLLFGLRGMDNQVSPQTGSLLDLRDPFAGITWRRSSR